MPMCQVWGRSGPTYARLKVIDNVFCFGKTRGRVVGRGRERLESKEDGASELQEEAE